MVAELKTSMFADRRTMIKSLSVEAAQKFEDGFFDYIYVDAVHTEVGLAADLEAWYPKLRPGGLMAGDDYGENRDTEFVTARRWAAEFGTAAKDWKNQWGVISAVWKFTQKIGVEYKITWMKDCYGFPAWYFIKPEDDDGGR